METAAFVVESRVVTRRPGDDQRLPILGILAADLRARYRFAGKPFEIVGAISASPRSNFSIAGGLWSELAHGGGASVDFGLFTAPFLPVGLVGMGSRLELDVCERVGCVRTAATAWSYLAGPRMPLGVMEVELGASVPVFGRSMRLGVVASVATWTEPDLRTRELTLIGLSVEGSRRFRREQSDGAPR